MLRESTPLEFATRREEEVGVRLQIDGARRALPELPPTFEAARRLLPKLDPPIEGARRAKPVLDPRTLGARRTFPD